MSLELMVGFDTDIDSTQDIIWDSGSHWVRLTPGRFGGGCAGGQYAYYFLTLKKSLAPVTTRVVGMAISLAAYTDNEFIQFMDMSHNMAQVSVGVSTTGALRVKTGTITLATTVPNFLRLNAWYYIEMKTTIGATGYGSFEVRLGESIILTGSGVQTQQSVSPYTDGILIKANGGGFASFFDFIVDDLYVLNTSGSKNNDFLGEQKIITSVLSSDLSVQFTPEPLTTPRQIINLTHPYPLGSIVWDGVHAWRNLNDNTTWNSGIGWTMLTGTNFEELISSDSDNGVTQSNIIGQKDLFGYEPISSTNNSLGQWYNGNDIIATKATVVARKDDTGYRNISLVLKSGATEIDNPFGVTPAGYSLTTVPLLSTFESYSVIFENDPNTSSSWTKTALNAAAIGYVVSG